MEIERAKYVEELNLALLNQEKALKQKAQFEVEALRARFKMMASTGAFFDRSPSTSESEQIAEVSWREKVLTWKSFSFTIHLRDISRRSAKVHIRIRNTYV